MKKRIMSFFLSLAIIVTFIPSGVMGTSSKNALLASFTRTAASAAEKNGLFTADDGELLKGAELTAWDNNKKITIGGTNKTPVDINNTATKNGWQKAADVGVDNATAFQIKFSTIGYEEIKFSCKQKSTSDGPNAFRLAYRIGSEGSFKIIKDSLVNSKSGLPGVNDDSYDALQQTYYKFTLPAAVNNKKEVYLRIYYVGSVTGKKGNTSINDIRITSGDYNPYKNFKSDSPTDKNLAFSKKSGFYNDPFSLTLSTNLKNGVIRYTTDGSEPTSSSAIYTKPIKIENRSGIPSGRYYEACNFTVKGTGTEGIVIGLGKNESNWEDFGRATVDSNGNFKLTASMTKEQLESFNGTLRIYTPGWQNQGKETTDFTITDMTVTSAATGKELYNLQKDLAKWNNGTLYFSGNGGSYDITGSSNSKAIKVTNRTAEWNGPLFNKSHLAIIEKDADLSVKSENAPNSYVSMGTVIRASIFDKNGKLLTEKVYTHSYFIGLKNQYPDLPVISLTTDSDNLFSKDDGIYNYPHEKGGDWERPVHFEIIEPDGTTHSQNMGMRIHGGYSRNYNQKSLRLYAKSSYDPDNPTLKYDIFDGNAVNANGKPVTEFQRIILRNTGNDNYNALMRDAFLQDVAQGLNVYGQSYRPSVVFINGEFWGFYNIRERVDEYFYRDKFALDDRKKVGYFSFTGNNWPEEYVEDPTNPDIIDDLDSYMEMYDWFNNLSGKMSAAEYEKAQKFLDMDNFIDYWAFNMAIGQGDWPQNNLNMWRYRTDFPKDTKVTSYNDGRWRYNLRDLDFSFDIHNDGQHRSNLRQTLNMQIPQTVFIQKLLTNDTFKKRFIDRATEITNTILDSDRVIQKINALSKKISPVIAEHIARWPQHIGSYSNWSNNVQRLRDFAKNRQVNFLNQLKSYF